MYNINAFDANNSQTFYFIWQGNQAFGNILQIRENNTNTIIYEEPEITMQLKYPLSPNVLKNGGYYNARVAVIDIDGNVSEFSDPILFYCFTTPTFIFDNIEENNNIFTGFSNIYDMAKHGHICEINLQNIKDVKDYYVVKENLKLCSTAELIPQAFLEALKVKNFTLAKSYLASPLNNASNNHFAAYFGPIQAIYYNCYNNSNPINYTVYNGEYKFYNFRIKDNKICDIEDCNNPL